MYSRFILKGFIKHNCSCANCHLTLDKNELRFADAILVHGHAILEIEKKTFEGWKSLRNSSGWPTVIYFNKEPPR